LNRNKSAAVILAAGSSQRMGRLGKKELLLLEGRPVLSHSIETFQQTGKFDTLLITCPAGALDKIAQSLPEKNQLYFTEGGATRQESVYNSLQWLKQHRSETRRVLIHDGARPWVSSEIINAVWKQCGEKGASIPVEPSTQAMKTLDDEGIITEHLHRASTWAAQTPQGFHFPEILQAHIEARQSDKLFIDDSEIWDCYQGKVWTVPGDPQNRKITYQGDINA